MIVVSIIGILSTTAIPSFVKYIEKARMVEAVQTVGWFRTAQFTMFTEHGYFGSMTTMRDDMGAMDTWDHLFSGRKTIFNADNAKACFGGAPYPDGHQTSFIYQTHAGDHRGGTATYATGLHEIAVCLDNQRGTEQLIVTSSTNGNCFGAGGGSQMKATDFGVSATPDPGYRYYIASAVGRSRGSSSDSFFDMFLGAEFKCNYVYQLVDYDPVNRPADSALRTSPVIFMD